MSMVANFLREDALTIPELHVSEHPLVRDKITRLRYKDLPSDQYRNLVRQITAFLLYEALASLSLNTEVVETPLAQCSGFKLAERVAFVPVLRAGCGMLDVALELVPDAQTWFLGMRRNEQTHEPEHYYNQMPAKLPIEHFFILEQMFATGGSACESVGALKGYNADVSFIALIAAPEGVFRFHREHPNVPMFVGALDEGLNEKAYIVPGLGDGGDRYYNTPPQ